MEAAEAAVEVVSVEDLVVGVVVEEDSEVHTEA